MKSTEYLAICLGTILAFGLLIAGACYLPNKWRKTARRWFLVHLYYPAFTLGIRTRMKRFDTLLMAIIIAGNVCAISIALVNMTLLCFGGRMNALASRALLREDRYIRLHRLFGALMAVEGGIHSVLTGITGTSAPNRKAQVPGIVASCALGSIFLSSLWFTCPWLFDVLSLLHTCLTIVLVVALWLHLPSGYVYKTPRLYILLSSAIFVAIKLLRVVNIMYMSGTQTRAIILVDRERTGVELRIQLTRPRDIRAGQFVYICLPGLSTSSILRSHPFQIAWTYKEKDEQVLVILVQPRRGFTRKLFLADPHYKYRATIEGPYGPRMRLDQFGTIVLLSTNIGVSAQLLFIKESLELYKHHKTKARRIALFWEIEAEAYRYWVRDWMDEALEMDTGYLLDIHVYIRGRFLFEGQPNDTVRLGHHSRITKHYERMNTINLVQSEIRERKGKTLISLCADTDTTEIVTRQVCTLLTDDISLHELEFRPWNPPKSSEERNS